MIQKRRQSWLKAVVAFAAFSMALLTGYPQTGVKVPLPTFTDITHQAGVEFKNVCGDEVTEFLIEVKGGGVCFVDYNNDGYQDIYIPNGSSRKRQKSGDLPHDYLLRNNGDGTFKDVTAEAGLGDQEWSWGCAVGDYDNDGYADLYVTNWGPNRLYHNNGNGTFTDVAEKAGVAGPKWKFPKWSTGATFADYDNDGLLDLYVANFVSFNYQPDRPAPNPNSPCKYKQIPTPCAPEHYDGQPDLLYHNNGNGTFTEVTEAAGIHEKPAGRGFTPIFADLDNDGDLDLYVANDAGPNFYYINDGKGKFTDFSFPSGTAVDGSGNTTGSMGLTIGDVNHDGLQELFVANFIDQEKSLYFNEGNNLFRDVTREFGLATIAFHYSSWGTKFFDFDNDGWLDLWIANGHTMEQLEPFFPDDPFAEPIYVLRNIAGKHFEDVSEATGIRQRPDKVGRGAAFADFDNDGDVDVIVINKNDFPTLWRNDGGNARPWIGLRLEGVKGNRDGYGAKIIARTAAMEQMFEARTSDSFLSANDPRLIIGLGDAKEADIEIRWLNGRIEQFKNVPAGTYYLAREGEKLQPDSRVKPARRTLSMGLP
jgi:hypothetical protein